MPIAPQIARLKIASNREKNKSISKATRRAEDGSALDTVEYASITVRKETTKVGRQRTFVAPAEPFLELQKIQLNFSLAERKENTSVKKITTETPIFSLPNGRCLSNRSIAYWFSYLIEKARIENLSKRNIVPYSFRHTYITNRVNAGHPVMAIAEDCGTSLHQITNTYYHTTERKRIANAFPDSYYDGSVLYPFDN
jgi:integrase